MSDSNSNPPHHAPVPFGKNLKIHASRALAHMDNGQGRCFVATDDRDANKQLIAYVSDAAALPRWTDVNAYKALGDPSFIRLVGSGVVNWTADNTQKHVIIYGGRIGAPLLKDNGYSQSTWRNPEVTEALIHPIARMLRDMKGRNFTHGAIRPTNIFLDSENDKNPIILGDCLSTMTMAGQTAPFLTIERSMTDPMGRGKGTAADDMYAFGVTMAFFLRKHNAIGSLSAHELLQKKVDVGSYNALVGSERFQASFQEMLRGTLHDDPMIRWTVDDLFAWLDGSRLTPGTQIKKVKASFPFKFLGKEYIHPELLAVDLHKAPDYAFEVVDNGTLEAWVNKSVPSEEMKKRFEMALGLSRPVMKRDHDFLTAHLAVAFNPMLPVFYKTSIFAADGVGGLFAAAAVKGQKIDDYGHILQSRMIDNILKMRGEVDSYAIDYMKMLERCRTTMRQKKVGAGMEACIYIMCPNAPCLSPKFQGYFVNGYEAMLLTLEKICGGKSEIPLLLDNHATGFLSVMNANMIEKSLYDLSSEKKDLQIAGNLRVLAALQDRSGSKPMPAIASVFIDSLSSVLKAYKNKELRNKILGSAKKAAQGGDLSGMIALLDDEAARTRDSNAFGIARREFAALQKEYNLQTERMVNRTAFGLSKGRDVAVVVAWVVSCVITLFIVLAVLSGYQLV